MGNFFKDLGHALAEPWKTIAAPIQWVKDIKDHPEHVANRQREAELAAWSMQNEYNTPANQVQRLRDAGLNPNLFYNMGDTGNAKSAPDLANYMGDKAQSINSVLGYAFNALQFLQQMQSMKLQNAQMQHQKEVLDFNKKKFIMDYIARQDYRSWEKGIVDKYGGKPGSLQYFLGRMIENITGQTPTDIATETGNYTRKLLNLVFSPLEFMGALSGEFKSNQYSGRDWE